MAREPFFEEVVKCQLNKRSERSPTGPCSKRAISISPNLPAFCGASAGCELAEAAAHRRGLEDTFDSYRKTAKAALAHVETADATSDVCEAIRISPEDEEDEIQDIQEDESMTRRALELLGSLGKDRYAAALDALREDAREWWADTC